MQFVRLFQALWANIILILLIALGYVLLITISVKADSEPYITTLTHSKIDVVFVFDTTNSMQDKINDLLNISSRFASTLEDYGGDYQLAMVCFGTIEEDGVIRDVFKPSNNLSDFQSFLNRTNAYGGGPEDQLTALLYAINDLKFRSEAHKVLILITDEPLLGIESHGEVLPLNDWHRMMAEVEAAGFTAYSICTNEDYYRSLAENTGGKFYDIEWDRDFTGILINIAEEINISLTH